MVNKGQFNRLRARVEACQRDLVVNLRTFTEGEPLTEFEDALLRANIELCEAVEQLEIAALNFDSEKL